MNAASQKRLAGVHPELARRVAAMIAALASRGVIVEVVQGQRSFAEQDALYAQGRTKPGRVVTRARGGQSNHNYQLAVDLCPFVDGQPDWNAKPALWDMIGEEARRAKLEWGGDWKHFTDRPHVQLPVGLTISDCQRLYRQGGLPAIAAEANRRLGLSS